MLSWDLGVMLLLVDFVSVGESYPLPDFPPIRVHSHDAALHIKSTLLPSFAITRLEKFYQISVHTMFTAGKLVYSPRLSNCSNSKL